MKKVRFYKYHGLGNDYIVIDPHISDITLTPKAVQWICDRHTGIGSDGILYGPIKDKDPLSLRIFNPDGSEAEKSGNGLRIFAKYLYEHDYVHIKNFKIHTPGGLVSAHVQDDSANLIKIDMGRVTFRSKDIPLTGPDREVINESITIDSHDYQMTCLSIGNPHCVIPLAEISEQKARQLGPQIENHPLFPKRINMQLLKVIDTHTIEIQIWERGAGYTLASGSSSCAAASAAHKLGLIQSPITVCMPGGELLIKIDSKGMVYMTGPVEGVAEGVLHSDLLLKLETGR